MTFSQRVKEELLVQDIEHNTAKIELMAAFKALAIVEMDHSGFNLEIKTSQIKLTKRLLEIIKHEYPKSSVRTLVRNMRNFSKSKKLYVIRIESNVRELLFDLDLINNIDSTFIISFRDIIPNLKTEEEKRVYTRMYFCCSGSVNDPKNAQQYHLEITGQNIVYLQEIAHIVKRYNINLKITKRKNNNALYVNKSEEIADFLKFIKSSDLLFEFEDYRMIRDMMLINNRLNNADIANEMKKMDTSQKQIDAIKLVKDNDMFDLFGKKTQEIANLRLLYPDESLQGLSDITKQEISKSNIRYHLNLIAKKANLIDS